MDLISSSSSSSYQDMDDVGKYSDTFPWQCPSCIDTSSDLESKSKPELISIIKQLEAQLKTERAERKRVCETKLR
jgi:hypothetical protein